MHQPARLLFVRVGWRVPFGDASLNHESLFVIFLQSGRTMQHDPDH